MRVRRVTPEFYRGGGNSVAVPGYAVVRHQRELPLNRGRNAVRFSDVAALIDPTTVSFQSLTDGAGTSVVEQNFQFDWSIPEAAGKIHRPPHHRRPGSRQRRRIVCRPAVVDHRWLVLKRDDGSIQTLPHNAGGACRNSPAA